MTKQENRVWFIDNDGRAPRTQYIMYDNAINPSAITHFKRGIKSDFSGFRYALSSSYNELELDKDSLYKIDNKTVKFHAAGTDVSCDQDLKTWNATCDVLGAINAHHKEMIILKSDMAHEDYLYNHSKQIDEIHVLKFDAEDNKWAKPEHILKWDFLHNSTGIPLANAKALALLEELAHGDFEAIPTEIKMPDGSIIHDYKLINILNKIEMNDGIDFERSILQPERFRTENDKYETYCYKLDCLGEKNLGVCKLKPLGSSVLKQALKDNKITGLVLKNAHGLGMFLEKQA